ncbi:MAG: DNA-3-methyladenine glycosylase 2 family protein [Deltaproteobacteria bacterium]|nr:DNA-3-methyladenine glycosylase 2 family protein [Deltaproteobacteria bacterium]
MEIFSYGEREINHLKARDKTLAAAIEEIGLIRREITPDLYTSLVYSIVSQQISSKAATTICGRLLDRFCHPQTGSEQVEDIQAAKTAESVRGRSERLNPRDLALAEVEAIQQCGMSMRKASYIQELSRKVWDGSFDLRALPGLSDAELCAALCTLKGIGVWTAEMLMTFSLQRPNILSFDDMAIQRGLRMLYRHKKITRPLFEKYRKRYSPYASVASLYLWAIAGGACTKLSDPTAKQK